MPKEKVIVVMPAYNAALTLRRTVEEIPRGSVDEIILVDDASKDGTAKLARQLGLTVFSNAHNTGYGANQKVCYRIALEHGADYIVMIHPDYQYDSRLIPVAIEILKYGFCDVVLGCRVRTRKECLSRGMPLYKYLGNRFLTILLNVSLGQNLGEFHSGFRAFRRAVLEKIPFERDSDGFSFDIQFLTQAVHCSFVLGDIPAPVRYFKDSSSVNFYSALAYGLGCIRTIFAFYLNRCRLVNSHLFKPKE